MKSIQSKGGHARAAKLSPLRRRQIARAAACARWSKSNRITKTKYVFWSQKKHRFTLIVKTIGSRKSAELAVLVAFAKRSPDGCEFHLRKSH